MVPIAVRQGTRRICLGLPETTNSIKMQVNPELWRNRRIYKMSSFVALFKTLKKIVPPPPPPLQFSL